MCSTGPVGVMVKWRLFDGLVYAYSLNADWYGGDADEILPDSIHSKDTWCKGFLEGVTLKRKVVVWVVYQSL